MDYTKTIEYDLIFEYYGYKKAKRSQIPLINHIKEGQYILDSIGASDLAKRAYCLHPLLQADIDLENYGFFVASKVSTEVMMLAMEYRNIANKYLSLRVIRNLAEIELSPLVEVNQMLIADKIQNYKDFIIAHRNNHPRRYELEIYFQNWLTKLEVNNFDEWFEKLKGIS